MATEFIHTDLEVRILNLVKKRIKAEFKSRGIVFSGDIFIKPKPKKSRLDLFELNATHHLHVCNKNRITKDFIMSVNINYQDTDYERVKEFTEFLYFALIDSKLSENLIFRRYYQDMEYQTFKISPYLWLGNCPFFITHALRLKSI